MNKRKTYNLTLSKLKIFYFVILLLNNFPLKEEMKSDKYLRVEFYID